MNFVSLIGGNLSSLEECLQKISTNIITNISTLKRKVSIEEDVTKEINRKKRSKKKNEKKTKKERNKRMMRKAEEVVDIVTGGCLALDSLSPGSRQIKLCDMDMSGKLLPRYHINALTFLLENNYFEDEAIPEVQLLLRCLQEQKEKAAETHGKKKIKEKQYQTNIHVIIRLR